MSQFLNLLPLTNGIKYSNIPRFSNQFPEIVDFLTKSFFHYGTNTKDFDQRIQHYGSMGESEFKEFCLQLLKNGHNLIATTEQNKIAGVALSNINRKEDLENQVNEWKNKQSISMFETAELFVFEENLKLDLYKRFGVSEIFNMSILAVDSLFHGQQIGRKLTYLTVKMAEETGVKVAKVESPNVFLQNVFTSLGFEVAAEMSPNQTVWNGKQLFDFNPPHKSFKIMYKLLNY